MGFPRSSDFPDWARAGPEVWGLPGASHRRFPSASLSQGKRPGTPGKPPDGASVRGTPRGPSRRNARPVLPHGSPRRKDDAMDEARERTQCGTRTPRRGAAA
ncbi:hypothetical protein GCM10023192_67260 [Amycolatopsis samaneae]